MKLSMTFEVVPDPNYTAVMVYCGDRRFRKTFEGFPQKVLQLNVDEVFPICVPGGPTPLAHPNQMASRCKGLTKYVLFVCREIRSICRVVLCSHGDCRYRCTVPHQCHHQEKERGELPLAGSAIKTALENAPDLDGNKYAVELYHTDFLLGGKEIGVEQIEISPEIPIVPQAWTRSYQTA